MVPDTTVAQVRGRFSPLIAAALAAICCILSPVQGQPDDAIWLPPANAIAWWAMDPTPLGAIKDQKPGQLLLESVARAAVAGGLFEDDETTGLLATVLGAGVLSRVPHRICLIDFAADPTDDGGLDVRRLSLVLELRTGRNHDELLRTVRAIVLQGSQPNDGGAQNPLELPGGRSGGAYRRDGWPDWREVSWCSDAGAFYVAIGRGTLAKWFEREEAIGPVGYHRQAIQQQRPAGRDVFEAFINTDVLRRAVPESFMAGRAKRMGEAWGLSNSRTFMLHGRLVDQPKDGLTLLAVDASWTARSLARDDVQLMGVTASVLPQDAGVVPGNGSRYVVLLPAQWEHWRDLCLDSVQAYHDSWGGMEFGATRRRWERDHGRRATRLFRSLGPWVTLAGGEGGSVVPTMAAISLGQRVKGRGALDDLHVTLKALFDRVEFDQKEALLSVHFASAGIDPDGKFASVWFGLAGQGWGGVGAERLVARWSREAIVRERLKR